MKERNEIDPALFSTGANILEKSNNGTKYQIECDTPNGTMQCIHLFPGIDLAYTSFQALSCFSRNKAIALKQSMENLYMLFKRNTKFKWRHSYYLQLNYLYLKLQEK